MGAAAAAWMGCSQADPPSGAGEIAVTAKTTHALEPGWTPQNLNPLARYVAADSNDFVQRDTNGNVDIWLDQSGNGRHAHAASMYSRPEFHTNTWGTKPTLRFTGSQIMVVDPWSGPPAGLNAGMTVLAVVRPTGPQNSGIASWWDVNGGGVFWAGLRANGAVTLPDLTRNHEFVWTQPFSGPHDLGTGPHAIAWRYVPPTETETETIKLTVDGTTSESRAFPSVLDLPSMPLYIGARSGLPTGIFTGDLSELVIVGSSISEENVQSFMEYARQEWQGGLPTEWSIDPCVDANGNPTPQTTRCDDTIASTYGDHCLGGTCTGSVPPAGNPGELSPIGWYHAGAAEVVVTDGGISTWYDRSQNRYDLLEGFYYGRPPLATDGWAPGKDTIHFTGSHVLRRDHWAGSVPGGIDNAFSVLAVVRSVSSQNAALASWWTRPNGASTVALKLNASGSDSLLSLTRFDDYLTTQTFPDTQTVNASDPHVLVWRYAAGLTKFTIDGTTTQSEDPTNVGPITATEFLIGAQNDLTGSPNLFNGHLAELAVVSGTISDAAVAAFHNYAQAEWGGFHFACHPSCDGKVAGQDNGCGAPCGGAGGVCDPDAPCAGGLFCQGNVCTACPTPCTTVACGTPDACGVTCQCGSQGVGQDCGSDSDCGAGLACGRHNGGCLGLSRARSVCWPTACADGVDPTECGSPGSLCGESCSCVTGCDADNPSSTCPPGDECKPNLGPAFGSPSPDVCLPPICPSNDPAYCGQADSLCGAVCICTPDCSQATCENPGDHCGHLCPGVCDINEGPCTDPVVCKNAGSCPPPNPPEAPRVCRESMCATAVLRPPLCGHPGAVCGDECPLCTPNCDGKECGTDPVCGQSCGECAGGMFCDGGGQCRTPNETPPVTGPGGTAIPDLPRTAAFGVGATPGYFNVTPQGSADYSIPIVVPPGRAGLEPSLSLHYVGSRLDGDAGLGWRVEGFSTIARCPRIHALDGGATPIQNDSSDKFCLDGKRLWKVGSGTYGANGVVYHTPIDGFSKIVSYVEGHDIQRAVAGGPKADDNEQGPDYFKVWTKDGRILTYGRSCDSLIVAPNNVRRSWLLSKVEDRSHNTILINYENPANTQQDFGGALPVVARPSRVAYTGHDDGAGNETAGTREVRFSYQTRPDPSFRFAQGGLVSLYNDRLSQITTYVNNAAVRNYSLKYRDAPPSQLEELRECEGESQLRCKPATKFGYSVASTNHFESESYPFTDFSSMARLDVDGDGKSDFLEQYLTVDGVPANGSLAAWQTVGDIAGQVGIDIAVATGAISGGVGAVVGLVWTIGSSVFFGSLAAQPVVTEHDVLFRGTGDRPPSPPTEALNVTGLPCTAGMPMFLLDFNRDGKDDLAGVCGGGNANGLNISTWDGTRFQAYPGVSQSVVLLDRDIFNWTPPIMFDVNGDSLQDILYCKDADHFELQLRVANKPGDIASPYFLQPIEIARGLGDPLPICGTAGLATSTHTIFDVDGDGTQDLIARDTSQPDWKVLRYTPGYIHWETLSLPDVGQSAYGQGMTIGDYNGDGLADVTRVDGHNLVLWINTGNGGFVARTFTHPAPEFSGYKHRRTAVFDYDNDGNDDLVENWSISNVDNINQAVTFNSDMTAVGSTPLTDIHLQIPGGNLVNGAFDLAADVDGDGATDLFGHQGIFYGIPGRTELLTSVVDGVGNQVTIRYDETNAYSSDCSGTQWPDTCLKRMTGLVTSYNESVVEQDGTTASPERGVSYKYQNGRMNLTGHGWLGFDKITESETFGGGPFPPTARQTVTEYEPPARYDMNGHELNPDNTYFPYVYPLTGMARTVTVTQQVSDDATPLEPGGGHVRRTRTINSWDAGLSSANLPFPKLAQTETRIYDSPSFGPEDGPFESACFETLLTDTYGNVYDRNKSCDIGEFTHTTAPVTADETNWLIANPDRITITATKAFVGDNQVQVWDPDYQDGVLSSLTRSPDDTGQEYHRTEYHRDEYGNPYEIVESVRSGEASRTTFITYDDDHIYPQTITNPKNQTSQVRFDPYFGTPTTVSDPNGITIQRSYDGLGLLSQTIDQSGTTIYAYSTENVDPTTPMGAIRPRTKVQVDRQGATATHTGSTVRELDSHGRVVRTTTDGFDGAKVVQERAFDARGRLAGTTLPHTSGDGSDAFTAYQYDGLDRLTLLQHSDGTYAQRQYASTNTLDSQHLTWLSEIDCVRNPYSFACAVDIVNTIDESQHRNVVVADRSGHVLRNVDGNNFDSVARVTTYVYDGLGRAGGLHENAAPDAPFSGPVHGQLYDGYGRLKSHYDPDTGWTSNTYNGFDELKTTQDPAARLRTFFYDDLGRVTSVTDDQGSTTWDYDSGSNAVGRLTAMTSPPTTAYPAGQRVDYTYEPVAANNRGLLSRATYTIDGVAYSIDYDYDDLGRTLHVGYPDLGAAPRVTVEYGYDPSGLLSDLKRQQNNTLVPLWHMSQAFRGYRVEHETFGNDALTVNGFDGARHWLNTITTTQGSTNVQALTYTRHDNGQVERRESALVPAMTDNYTYDLLARLETSTRSVAGGPPNLAYYHYDDYGNIVQKGLDSLAYLPTQPHLIDTVESNSYHYDASGNVSYRSGPDVPGGTQTITYTPFNLPDHITTGGEDTRFEYSADQERLVRRDTDVVVHFVANSYERRASIGGTTQEERFRLYVGSRVIGEIVRKAGLPERTLYFHGDAIDTVSTVSYDDGSSANQQAFDPFGLSTSDPTATRAGFTGQDHDRDLGLIDMRGRIYDPFAGRFLSPDPISQNPFWSQGLNRYGYVFNDPINASDPSGYFSFSPEEGAAIAVGFVGFAFAAGALGSALGPGGLGLAAENVAGPAASALAREALQAAAGKAAGQSANLGSALANPKPGPLSPNLNCNFVDCVDASRVPQEIARRAQSWAWLRGPYSRIVGHEAGDTEALSPTGEMHLDRAKEGIDNGDGVGFREHNDPFEGGDTPVQYHHTHNWYHSPHPSAQDATNIVGHPGRAITTFKAGGWPANLDGTSLNVMWVEPSGALKQAFISPWLPMP